MILAAHHLHSGAAAGVLGLVIVLLLTALVAAGYWRTWLRARRNPSPKTPVAASRQASLHPRDSTPYEHPGWSAGPDHPEGPQ